MKTNAIKDLEKFAKSNKVAVKGLEDCPELFSVKAHFFFDDEGTGEENLFDCENINLNVARKPNGAIYPLKGVSNQYTLVQHHEVIHQTLESILTKAPEFGIPGLDLKFREDGGMMWASMLFPKVINVGSGKKEDILQPRVRVINSADTTKRFQIHFEALRQVCTNGLMLPDKRFKNATTIKRLHKGSFDLQKSIEIMMGGFESYSESIGLWKEYAKIEMQKQPIVDILLDAGFSENQALNILDTPLRGTDNKALSDTLNSEKPVSAWLAYNAATQYITDAEVSPNLAIDRGRRVSEGFERFIESVK